MQTTSLFKILAVSASLAMTVMFSTLALNGSAAM